MISKDRFSGSRSSLKMNIQFLMPYFNNLKIQAKELISKEDIQELLVKPLMEYSHYTTCVHKFVISMEEYKNCNIALDVKKAHIFNSKVEKILA